MDFVSRRLGYVLSAAGADIRTQTGGWGGEKGGEMTVDVPGQNVWQPSDSYPYPPHANRLCFAGGQVISMAK